MATAPKTRMTVDEFLVWAEDRPGRYELVGGEVVARAPERTRHAETKAAVYTALSSAVREAGVECRVLPDGMTVRIDRATAYEPDALVYCGPRLAGDSIEVPSPVIVVEVVSPGTARVDAGAKLTGYFRVPSVEHYLLVDPVRAVVVHHRRTPEVIETRILSEGRLYLEPPGIELIVADLFADA